VLDFLRAHSQDKKTFALRAFLAGTLPHSLTIATTTISTASEASSGVAARLTVRVTVVTSAALYATIPHVSEALRASIPGVERFKRAAAENIPRRSHASATLVPTSGAEILPYLPVLLLPVHDHRGPARARLPHRAARRAAPAGPGVDTAEARAAFVPKVTEVLYAAYRDGAHVDMVYAPDGSVVGSAEAGEGKPVVEYFRCGGWQWVPEDGDESVSVLCADGTIFALERGESARCAVQSAKESAPTFAVHGR
jgi:hypothetical protein